MQPRQFAGGSEHVRNCRMGQGLTSPGCACNVRAVDESVPGLDQGPGVSADQSQRVRQATARRDLSMQRLVQVTSA